MDQAWTDWTTQRPLPEYRRDDGTLFLPGDRVYLTPRDRADVFDLALAGKIAVVESIEQDLEGGFLFAVTVEDDPGRDLGIDGKPGHRFYYRPHEVQPLRDVP